MTPCVVCLIASHRTAAMIIPQWSPGGRGLTILYRPSAKSYYSYCTYSPVFVYAHDVRSANRDNEYQRPELITKCWRPQYSRSSLIQIRLHCLSDSPSLCNIKFILSSSSLRALPGETLKRRKILACKLCESARSWVRSQNEGNSPMLSNYLGCVSSPVLTSCLWSKISASRLSGNCHTGIGECQILGQSNPASRLPSTKGNWSRISLPN
jgi:hypothetical protein